MYKYIIYTFSHFLTLFNAKFNENHIFKNTEKKLKIVLKSVKNLQLLPFDLLQKKNAIFNAKSRKNGVISYQLVSL
jgi:hypothetical protein